MHIATTFSSSFCKYIYSSDKNANIVLKEYFKIYDIIRYYFAVIILCQCNPFRKYQRLYNL